MTFRRRGRLNVLVATQTRITHRYGEIIIYNMRKSFVYSFYAINHFNSTFIRCFNQMFQPRIERNQNKRHFKMQDGLRDADPRFKSKERTKQISKCFAKFLLQFKWDVRGKVSTARFGNVAIYYSVIYPKLGSNRFAKSRARLQGPTSD